MYIMGYFGGKATIAKRLSEFILSDNENTQDKTLVSLFCGMCSVESKLAPYFGNVICNDKQEYLIAMLKAAQQGREFPTTITEDDYYRIRNEKDRDKALSGFVGFNCSFSGKWFSGYARGKHKNPNGDIKVDNYAEIGNRNLKELMKTLSQAMFTNRDYRDVIIPENAIVYCDPPPYAGTEQKYGLPRFDSETFWEYIRELSKTHKVYVSEQTAPPDFVSVWSLERKRFCCIGVSTKELVVATENLFVKE